jgi:hypothetical protein
MVHEVEPGLRPIRIALCVDSGALIGFEGISFNPAKDTVRR